MSAIAYAFTEVNTAVTATNTSYANVSGCSIGSGSFTAGKQYLILVTAQTKCSVAGNFANLQVAHGGTAFAESRQEWIGNADNTEWNNYVWFTVWTAVGGEAITLQNLTDGSTTQTINFVAMLALNLSDDLTENTDWFQSERTTDDGITTTPTAGGTVTFTPGTAGHDWLVLTNAQCQQTTNATGVISSMTRSGEAASTTPSTSAWINSNFSIKTQHTQARVFSLGAASNTFTENISATSGTSHTRLNSKCFVLNLNKFSARASAYTEGDVALSASDYATEIQTVDISPPTTECFVLAQFGFDAGNSSREVEFRLQSYVVAAGEADAPAGQTTANNQFHPISGNALSECALGLLTKISTTSGNTYRHDVDASADSTTGTPAAQYRSLIVFSAELAAAAMRPMFRGS